MFGTRFGQAIDANAIRPSVERCPWLAWQQTLRLVRYQSPTTLLDYTIVGSTRARGAIAQLGERLDRTQEVAGSSPASSIGTDLQRILGCASDGWSNRHGLALSVCGTLLVAAIQPGRAGSM